MKKKASFLLAVMIMIALITACGSKTDNSDLIDGLYSVTFDKADSTDWKAFLILTVEQNKIADVNFDYEGIGTNEGKLKSEDEAYNEAMLSSTGTNPQMYLNALETSLMKSGDPESISVVSGATTSSNDFIQFAKEAIKAAKDGNHDPIVIKQP
jgi:major membrane immunogen (membrane-anchored lipoprotein)